MFHTKNELEHFDFAGAEVIEAKAYRDQIIFQLGFVKILPENTCNRDIRVMGTNELTLKFLEVTQYTYVEEGYKVFDADGNLMNTVGDKTLQGEQALKAITTMENMTIYSIEKTENEYRISLDGLEQTFLVVLQANGDSQEWERFRNVEASY